MKIRTTVAASGLLFLFWFSWVVSQVLASGSVIENALPFVFVLLASALWMRTHSPLPGTLGLLAVLPLYGFIVIDYAVRGGYEPGIKPVLTTIAAFLSTWLLIAQARSSVGAALGMGAGIIVSILANDTMLAQVVSLEPSRAQRFGGTMHVNAFGVLVVVAAIGAASNLTSINSRARMACGALLLLYGTLAFLFLGSRQVLASVVLILTSVVLALFALDIKPRWKLLLVGMLLMLSNVLFGSMIEGDYGYRFIAAYDWITGASTAADHSLDDRRVLLAAAFREFLKFPVLGQGLWSYGSVTGFGAYAHNNFAELLVAFGLAGLPFSLLPYFLFGMHATKSGGATRLLAYGALAAMTVVEISNVTIGKAFAPVGFIFIGWMLSTRSASATKSRGEL